MTTEDRDELHAQAVARASAGCRTSTLILDLLGELDELREKFDACIQDHHAATVELVRKDDLIRGLCARVEAQSELLAKRAAKSPITPANMKLARAAFLTGLRLSNMAYNLAQLDPPTPEDWKRWCERFTRERKAWDEGCRFLGKLCEEGA